MTLPPAARKGTGRRAAPGLATVGTGTARNDPAEVRGIHDGLRSAIRPQLLRLHPDGSSASRRSRASVAHAASATIGLCGWAPTRASRTRSVELITELLMRTRFLRCWGCQRATPGQQPGAGKTTDDRQPVAVAGVRTSGLVGSKEGAARRLEGTQVTRQEPKVRTRRRQAGPGPRPCRRAVAVHD